jgi:hypothetical protein
MQGNEWCISTSKVFGILFCTAKKVSKKLPTEKTRFCITASLFIGGYLAFRAFVKIDFCSHSFPLAWAFVVVQGYEWCMVYSDV